MANADPYSENFLRAMLGNTDNLGTSLWDSIWNPLLSLAKDHRTFVVEGAAQATEVCKQFLEEARKRSLAFNKWNECKANDGIVLHLSAKAMDDLLDNKEEYFEQLPAAAMEKFEGSITDTFISKYKALKGLIDRHNGENVDVHTGSNIKWKLIRLETWLFQALPDQFDLGPNHQAPRFSEYDRIALEQHMKEISASCEYQTPRDLLKPDFTKQINRLVVPCQGTPYYSWVRSGHVISLGELFQKMQSRYNARQIYDLYLHLDIVSVKRRKPGPKNMQSNHRWS